MANEKRLIDGNELLSKMHRLDEKQKTDVWMTCDIEALLEMQPTVDAVEVVHGRWAKIAHYPYYCSVCNEIAPLDFEGESHYKSNYCPNCGADMRERKDNEKAME